MFLHLFLFSLTDITRANFIVLTISVRTAQHSFLRIINVSSFLLLFIGTMSSFGVTEEF